MTLFFLVLGVALGVRPIAARDHDLESRYEETLELPPALYEGAVDAPPRAHWEVRLPGGRVGSGSHTERTRPVVAGGLVLVGSAAGSAMYALSRRDGSLVHTFEADAAVESQAVVQGQRLYFSDTAGTTWCYDLDGTLVWKTRGTAPILVRPTVSDGRVYVTDVDDLTRALDAESGGALLWRYRRSPDLTRSSQLSLYGAPPAVILEDLVLVAFSDGSVVALDAEKGDVVWDQRVGEGRYPDVVAAPVPWGSDIFASGYFVPFVAIDKTTRNVRWRLEVGSANAPAIDTESETTVLYHPGTDGVLRAVIALTGAEQWAWESGTDGALTTPLITGAGLLVGSSDGGLFLIDPADGTERWRYHEPVRLTGVTSAPTIDGRQVIFVTNAGFLRSMLAPPTAKRRERDRFTGR